MKLCWGDEEMKRLMWLGVADFYWNPFLFASPSLDISLSCNPSQLSSSAIFRTLQGTTTTTTTVSICRHYFSSIMAVLVIEMVQTLLNASDTFWHLCQKTVGSHQNHQRKADLTWSVHLAFQMGSNPSSNRTPLHLKMAPSILPFPLQKYHGSTVAFASHVANGMKAWLSI